MDEGLKTVYTTTVEAQAQVSILPKMDVGLKLISTLSGQVVNSFNPT